MDTKEILKKVRKIEIKTKRLSNDIFGGEYHSSFKGRGMTFSEVRQYQFGDDVRGIDWNSVQRRSTNIFVVRQRSVPNPRHRDVPLGFWIFQRTPSIFFGTRDHPRD